MPVLAAMGERKSRGIAEPARCAVQDLGHQGEGADRARANAGRQQQIGKVGGPALGRGGKVAMQAPQMDIAIDNQCASP